MKFSNVHQHTNFSDGKDAPEEVVLKAIENGLISIGFSDHSFTGVAAMHELEKEREEEYINEISLLKEKYSNKIDILTGIEYDAFTYDFPHAIDYKIASIHVLEHSGRYFAIDHDVSEQLGYIVYSVKDKLYFAEEYYKSVVENVKRVKPDIVGHLDVLTKFGLIKETAEYKDLAYSAVDEILKVCKVFEVNTGAIARGYKTAPYPADYLLKRILSGGGDIIITSDCHDIKNMTCHFKESAELIKSIGFTRFLNLTKEGFIPEKL